MWQRESGRGEKDGTVKRNEEKFREEWGADKNRGFFSRERGLPETHPAPAREVFLRPGRRRGWQEEFFLGDRSPPKFIYLNRSAPHFLAF